MIAGAGGLAALASVTRPFTGPAEFVLILAFTAMFTVVLTPLRSPSSPGPPDHRRSEASAAGDLRWGARWAWWVVPVAASLGWELFCYLGTPRASHPTLSSMLDMVDATHLGRGLAFGVWLVAGWYLVSR
jgi:hypothetical protein